MQWHCKSNFKCRISKIQKQRKNVTLQAFLCIRSKLILKLLITECLYLFWGELIKVVTSWLEMNHANFSVSDSDLKKPYGKGQGSKAWRGRGRRFWKGSSLMLL